MHSQCAYENTVLFSESGSTRGMVYSYRLLFRRNSVLGRDVKYRCQQHARVSADLELRRPRAFRLHLVERGDQNNLDVRLPILYIPIPKSGCTNATRSWRRGRAVMSVNLKTPSQRTYLVVPLVVKHIMLPTFTMFVSSIEA